MNEPDFSIRKLGMGFVTSTNISVTLLSIKDILIHEDYDPIIASDLAQKIQAEEYFTVPVVVDNKNFTLLDGHHRFHFLSEHFHAQFIPCVLIDYADENLVRVGSWRPEITVNRHVVQKVALTQNLLPIKTSRHTFLFELGELSIPLSRLGSET